MYGSVIRPLPLIAVISHLPLFLEGVVSALTGVAEVQRIDARDLQPEGLLEAFQPDAVVADKASAELVAPAILCLSVDLDSQELLIRDGGAWIRIEGLASPTAIRNVVVTRLYGANAA